MFIDDLAQEIRRVDGAHELGAGRLAEALAPFIYAQVDHYTDVACDLILGDEEDLDINAADVASGLLAATAQAHREIHAGVCIDVEQRNHIQELEEELGWATRLTDEEHEELCNTWYRRGYSGALAELRSHIDILDPETNDPCDTCYLIGPTIDFAIDEIGYFTDLGEAAKARASHIDADEWIVWVAEYDTEYGNVIRETARPLIL